MDRYTIIVFSFLVTVLIHYGRKRRTVDGGLEEEIEMDIVGSSPENFCYKTGDGKFVFLDHTGLLREFKRKLSYSNARYAALKDDFGKLKSVTKNFSNNSNKLFINHKNVDMENTMDQLSLQPDNNLVKITGEQNLNNETTSQSIQINDTGIEENILVNNNANEQSWLQDILEEKKKQIEFLQDQIDVLVKRNHISLQEREVFKIEVEKLKSVQQTIAAELETIRDEAGQKDSNLEKLQNLLEEKNEQLSESHHLVNAGQDRVIYLENLLTELKEQNQLLSAAIADAGDRNETLNMELEHKGSIVEAMEMKLLANKQLLQRLYNEFSNCLNEQTEASHLTAV